MKVTKRKDMVVVETTMAAGTPAEEAVRKVMLGGRTITYATAVRGGRQVLAMGLDAVKNLPDSPMAPDAPLDVSGAPIIADILEQSRGAEVLIVMDPWAFVTKVAPATPQGGQMTAMLNAVPGLAQLRMPMALYYRAGDSGTWTLSLPVGVLANAAKVIQPFMGMMGGKPKS